MQNPRIPLLDGLAHIMDAERVEAMRNGGLDGHGRLDIVLLDMDGTLTPGRSSWELVHHHYGVDNEANWRAYQEGRITDEEFMRSDIELWHRDSSRVHLQEIHDVLADVHLTTGLPAFLQALRDRGLATAIVSGGLDVLAHRIAREHGVDLVLANTIATDADGFLTGESECRVRIDDKATPTTRLLDALGIPPERAASVGNSRWDAGMFERTGFGVAFQAMDDHVREAADVVVDVRDLRAVLPHLDAYAAGSP